MGRVSSKRKVKQCDPFFRGKRNNMKGKKVTEYDLAPVQSKRSKKRKRKGIDDDAIEQYVIRSSGADGTGAAGTEAAGTAAPTSTAAAPVAAAAPATPATSSAAPAAST